MKLRQVLLVALACCTLAYAKEGEHPYVRHGEKYDADKGDFDWLTAHEFMGHLHTLSRASRTLSPFKVPGYTKSLGEKVFNMHKAQAPAAIDHFVNLANFYSKNLQRRIIDPQEKVEDIAGRLRRRHHHQRFLAENLPVASDSDAENIDTCPTDAVDDQDCDHFPCVKPYLFGAYEEYSPGYGGQNFYFAFTATIDLFGIWSGNVEDRTDTDAAAIATILSAAQNFAKDITDATCDGAPDDIDICVLCAIFEVPHPSKVVCETIDAIISTTQVAFDTLIAQIDYQDGLVDAAEIEASYEHTRNLLQKSCATFDQAVCRCAKEVSPGQGCDGIDTDCDDDIDECDEDQTPPTIDLSTTIEVCGNGRWFQNVADAIQCVEETLLAYDDCQVLVSAPTVTATVDCAASQSTTVTITATEDVCGKTTTEEIELLIDDGDPPVVSCDMLDGVITKEPESFIDTQLEYEATDTCSRPGEVNVTLEVYVSEIDDVKGGVDMCRFTTTGVLYCHNEITENFQNNRVGIVDPKNPEAHLYTVVITGVDLSGLQNSTECTFEVAPDNKGPYPFDESTQRFAVTNYATIA